MVAEKQCCWMKITFHGRGGHGSMPVHHQAMAKLARTIRLLDQNRRYTLQEIVGASDE
jgi:acetylornithine deacetylase/succinyl-diaminopimelate desuccinylase-like protein